MSTIRNLSGAPESPLAAGRKHRSPAKDSPGASLIRLKSGKKMSQFARSLSHKKRGSEDSEGEDDPAPPQLTFDDDAVPALHHGDIGGGAGESKEKEIEDYFREMEQEYCINALMEERETGASRQGATPPSRDATGEGGGRDREGQSDETEGTGRPAEGEGLVRGTEVEGSVGGRGSRRSGRGSRRSRTKTTNPRPMVSFADSVDDTERKLSHVAQPRSSPSLSGSELSAATPGEGKGGDDDEGRGRSAPAAPPTEPNYDPQALPATRQYQQSIQQPKPRLGLLARLISVGDHPSNVVGLCIVRMVPCCWCATRKLGRSATDREILLLLNRLCAFLCVVQIACGVSNTLMKLIPWSTGDDLDDESNPDEDKPLISLDLWSLDLFVFFSSCINLVLLVASMVAQRAIRDVNLVGSVRFMWVLYWLLPLQIFCIIGLFDTHKVNIVNIKHWWGDLLFKMIRELSCEEGTAHGKCMVPIGGGSLYRDEMEWCVAEHDGDTDCKAIRDNAQDFWNVRSTIFFTTIGVLQTLLVVLIWVILNLLQAIITLPIVQRSKEGNIPLWLTVPMVGCYAFGYILTGPNTSIENLFPDILWIAVVFFVDGACFTLAAGLGLALKFYTVLNSQQRRIKQGFIIVFLGTIMLTIFGVATIFVASLIYSLDIVDLPESLREIACVLDIRGSCTGCDKISYFICPEWTDTDVERVLQTIMKMVASVAAIYIVYTLVALQYGFVLLRHVSQYRIEYV